MGVLLIISPHVLTETCEPKTQEVYARAHTNTRTPPFFEYRKLDSVPVSVNGGFYGGRATNFPALRPPTCWQHTVTKTRGSIKGY